MTGTNGDVIDSAPTTGGEAKRMMITFGQTVSVTLQDRKYNVTPGWARSGGSSSEFSAP